MLLEYYHNCTCDSEKRAGTAQAVRSEPKFLSDWKRKIPDAFSSLKLHGRTVEVSTVIILPVNEPLNITVRIDPGKLEPGDLLVS